MRYSQNNEQDIILNYFKGNTGCFLDIGANDGITLSNTYGLTLDGWQGTLVEASPSAYAKLKETHRGTRYLQFIHAAATDYNGEITLHESGEHLGVGDTALLSSTYKGETYRWKKETFTEVTVPAINFETLLGLSQIKKFDFISMDCEGCEICLLEQMDLKALGCKLVCVEYNGKDQHLYDAIVLPQGYKLLHKNGENLIYEVL